MVLAFGINVKFFNALPSETETLFWFQEREESFIRKVRPNLILGSSLNDFIKFVAYRGDMKRADMVLLLTG